MNAVMSYYLYANAPAGLGFDKADAAQLISLYATVVGMTTIIGSYVCDRILGCRRSASFQTIPAIFAVCFGSFLTMLWTKLGKKQPFGTTKMGFGTILWGLGAMIIALLYIIYPGDAKVNAWWIVLFYAVLMFAEGFTCPIGYSITAVAAPKAFVTQMMTVWSMSQSVGAALNMILVNFYKEGSEVPFFIGIGAVVAILGAVVLAFSKKLAEGMGMEREA